MVPLHEEHPEGPGGHTDEDVGTFTLGDQVRYPFTSYTPQPTVAEPGTKLLLGRLKMINVNVLRCLHGAWCVRQCSLYAYWYLHMIYMARTVLYVVLCLQFHCGIIMHRPHFLTVCYWDGLKCG